MTKSVWNLSDLEGVFKRREAIWIGSVGVGKCLCDGDPFSSTKTLKPQELQDLEETELQKTSGKGMAK